MDEAKLLDIEQVLHDAVFFTGELSEQLKSPEQAEVTSAQQDAYRKILCDLQNNTRKLAVQVNYLPIVPLLKTDNYKEIIDD